MPETSLPFAYDLKQVSEELLENMQEILKDSDAVQEKEIIKKYLKNASDPIHFMVIGPSGAGKTSLIKILFDGVVEEQSEHAELFTEYRWGEQDARFVMDDGTLRIFKNEEILRGISIFDTTGIEKFNNQEEIRNHLSVHDTLFVVLTPDTIMNFDLWDILENLGHKNLIFILNKIDLFHTGEIKESFNKLSQYIKESGFSSPVFEMSVLKDPSKVWELKDYVNQKILGDHPEIRSQRANIGNLKNMLSELKDSFELRKAQNEEDIKTLKNINEALDSFRIENKEQIHILKKELQYEIDSSIEDYQNEIIERLNPKKLKERFSGGYQDFVDYLNFVNENYQKQMTDKINLKTQDGLRDFLSKIEDVFQETVGYFKKRESLIALEDKFYGSMAKGKQVIVKKIGSELKDTHEFYNSLLDTSSELFLQIWKERKDFDKKVNITSGVAGTVVTGGLLAGITVTGGIALAPVIGAIVGGIAVAAIAKKISAAMYSPHMESKVQEAINDFKEEVAKTRSAMTERIMGMVDDIFWGELDKVDKTFLEYRMSTNIDSKNIPLLEQKMEEVDKLLEKVQEKESL